MSSHRPDVAVVGTCDTKLEALVFVKHAIQSSGCNAILVDIGTYDPVDSSEIDISRHEVLGTLQDSPTQSRIAAAELMIAGLSSTLSRLHKANSIAAAIGAGGSGNTSVCTKAFRDALPIGFPKLMVSTMASGNVSHYVGETDITMMYSVVDIAGMNSILEIILGNAARAIAGMAIGSASPKTDNTRPAVAITMFGLTTPCVVAATKRLEELGYDSVVFHCTGAGGISMERLITERRFVGVLDITTTEWADELVGGVLAAGPRRLEAAARTGIPQVVSIGALDMVNFGPSASIPERFKGRLFHEHNPSVTLMRTSREECVSLGEILSEKLNLGSADLTRLILPLRGMSGIDVEGAPFHDAEADKALLDTLRDSVRCPVLEMDMDINDARFALAAVDALEELIDGST